MERVDIWYLSDNLQGKRFAQKIKELGLSVNTVTSGDLKDSELIMDTSNIFIFDLIQKDPAEILAIIRKDQRLHTFLKFIIIKKGFIKPALASAMNLFHVEFITRPINKREFILLLEKCIIVERYKEMMKLISKKAEEKINTFDNLMSINRKDFFKSESEKQAFEKIIEYEKHFMSEQARMNKAMKDFAYLRQREMFDIRGRIKETDILENIRWKEETNEGNIESGEKPASSSIMKIEDANEIIDATEKVIDLSIMEKKQLLEELKKEKKKNSFLVEEIERLKNKFN
jgi:hypothetical protein